MIPAKCHPKSPHHAKGLCNKCYIRALYAKARKAGYPPWVAQRRTYQGRVRQLENDNRWHRANPESYRAAGRRYKAKMKRLYGGAPDHDPVARIRWAIAKDGPPGVEKKSRL